MCNSNATCINATCIMLHVFILHCRSYGTKKYNHKSKDPQYCYLQTESIHDHNLILIIQITSIEQKGKQNYNTTIFSYTGDIRHGSRLFWVVFKMNFGESELHNGRSYGYEFYCILLLNMFCICMQLFISKYLLKRKI